MQSNPPSTLPRARTLSSALALSLFALPCILLTAQLTGLNMTASPIDSDQTSTNSPWAMTNFQDWQVRHYSYVAPTPTPRPTSTPVPTPTFTPEKLKRREILAARIKALRANLSPACPPSSAGF